MGYEAVITCGIIGQRDLNEVEYDDYPTLEAQLDSLFATSRPDKLVSGGSKGIERMIERYAKARGIVFSVVRPNMSRDGSEAFDQRNAEIVSVSDYIMIFWDGKHRQYEAAARLAALQRKLATFVPMLG